jgi:hypothetical protein
MPCISLDGKYCDSLRDRQLVVSFEIPRCSSNATAGKHSVPFYGDEINDLIETCACFKLFFVSVQVAELEAKAETAAAKAQALEKELKTLAKGRNDSLEGVVGSA